MKKIITISLAIVGALVLFAIFSGDKSKDERMVEDSTTYKNISAAELEKMLENKDFVLIDTHIPEQRHIPGTDYFIPYNEIDNIKNVVSDKNQKIVLYCRSGSMSKIASERLSELGYKNVFNLEGGVNEWIRYGKSLIPQGSVKTVNNLKTPYDNENEGDNNIKEFVVVASNFSFSKKQIKVKQGDRVRIILKNSQGMHDFRIDELGVGTRILQEGEQDAIEFTADKKGKFSFYCSVGNHRALGMEGEFIVE